MGFGNRVGYNRTNKLASGTEPPVEKDKLWFDFSVSPVKIKYWESTTGTWEDVILNSSANNTVVVATKADLPASGDPKFVYIVKSDESAPNGGSSSYVWDDVLGVYKIIDDDLDANDQIDMGTF